MSQCVSGVVAAVEHAIRMGHELSVGAWRRRRVCVGGGGERERERVWYGSVDERGYHQRVCWKIGDRVCHNKA